MATCRSERVLIKIERLPVEEFHRLRFIDDGFTPDAEQSIAVVAKSDEKIIGRVFAVAPIHAEGIYIEPPWRGGTLFKDMMQALEIECKAVGVTRMYAYAVKPEIAHYLEHRIGYSKLPWQVFTKDI